jgi:SSS family solute:Na+ symporter
MGIGTSKASSWIIASVLGACTAQAGIQPLLAAKDIKTARRAAFITAAIVAPFGILTALLGMSARILYPNLENAKLALPTLMMHMNPVIGGIILASIFAAVLSTISPIILAAGTMFTKDIFQRFSGKEIPDQKLLMVSRASTGIAGLVCILLAIAFYGSTKILDMVYFAYTLRGALFIVLMYGIYWKLTSEKGAIISMVLTGAVGFFWVAWKSATGAYPIADWLTETYAAVMTAAIATIVFSLVFRSRMSESTPG